MTLKAGDVAPNFRVKDQDGQEVSLSDFKGRKVVLYFYPKDMTPGCTAEACNLRDNYKYLLKAGYEVLGISSDNEKMHKKFRQKEKLPFLLLADPDKVVHAKYGTWIEKSMYGRKYMGTWRVTFLIDENGIIDEVIGKVDTKNHTEQILKRPVEAKATKVIPIAKKAFKKVSSGKKVKKPGKKAARK